MASRMESNGEAGKTQISQEAKDLLRAEYPQYIIEERGEIPIKVWKSAGFSKSQGLRKIIQSLFWKWSQSESIAKLFYQSSHTVELKIPNNLNCRFKSEWTPLQESEICSKTQNFRAKACARLTGFWSRD